MTSKAIDSISPHTRVINKTIKSSPVPVDPLMQERVEIYRHRATGLEGDASACSVTDKEIQDLIGRLFFRSEPDKVWLESES